MADIWTPIHKGLPTEEGWYLCQYYSVPDDDIYTNYGISWFDARMNEFNFDHDGVVAWMPLPEPYKE